MIRSALDSGNFACGVFINLQKTFDTVNHDIPQFPPPAKIRGVLVFEIWTRTEVIKKLLRNRGFSRKGGGFSQKGDFTNCFISFPSGKHVFITIGILFCLINIHACCNQYTYSFMWFTFYQNMIYYENSFSFPFIFKYSFVKILLLMFISIFISLKALNILENKSQEFERSDCTITVYT